MKKLLMILAIMLMPGLCYGEIIVPEINPEHTLIKASLSEPNENATWHVFVWRGNDYNPVTYVLSIDKDCVFTGPPGTYLLVNGKDFAKTVIGEAPPPDILVSVNDTNVKEGDNGITPANFIISLNKASTEEIFVDYTTANNTAIVAEDYKPADGVLQFNPGETQKLITVEILGDKNKEEDESFFVKLTNISGNAGVGKDSGICTIINDDDPTPPPPPPGGFEEAVYQLGMKLPAEWREAKVTVDGEKVLLFAALGRNYDAVSAEAAATSMTIEQMINATKVRNITIANAENIEAIREAFFQPLAALIMEEDLDSNDKEGHIKLWKLIASAMKRIK
jgi:hypothetical protein